MALQMPIGVWNCYMYMSCQYDLFKGQISYKCISFLPNFPWDFFKLQTLFCNLYCDWFSELIIFSVSQVVVQWQFCTKWDSKIADHYLKCLQ